MMRAVPRIPDDIGDCRDFLHLVEKEEGHISSLVVTGSSFDGIMSCSLAMGRTAKTISHVVHNGSTGRFSILMGDRANPVPFSETDSKNEAWLRMLEAAAANNGARPTNLFEQLADKAAENIRTIAAILARKDIVRSVTGQPFHQRIMRHGKFELLRHLHPRSQKATAFESFWLRWPSNGVRFSLSPAGWHHDTYGTKAEDVPFASFIFGLLSRNGSISGHEKLLLAEAMTECFSRIEDTSDCAREFECPRYTSAVLSMRI